MAKESVDSVKNTLFIGDNQYNDYVLAQIIKCEVSIYKKKKKNNLFFFLFYFFYLSVPEYFIKTFFVIIIVNYF